MSSYWEGHAPGYSRDVERAARAVRAAEEALRSALEVAYPMGARVRVVHQRGSFTGTVDGWDRHGSRVEVRNHASGKTQKWWAAQVELIEARAQG